MKYFAKINENNLVLNIDVLNDAVAPDEATGITFLKTLKDKDQLPVLLLGSVEFGMKLTKVFGLYNLTLVG
jgi:hypothetical protein